MTFTYACDLNTTLKLDIILHSKNIGMNPTTIQQKILITRATSSGIFHVLMGNKLHHVTICDDQLVLHLIATIDDIGDTVSEFVVEELQTLEKKRYLIVCLYMEDRFQIYQILINGTVNNGFIKAIQKIRRPGESTRTILVLYATNLYLVAGYLESDSGKVARNFGNAAPDSYREGDRIKKYL
ncbi:uncharacterized protein LOC131679320 [Topomyia yanbarensis]|uniref:uncharacterized protein LOC131679320 n=1 Tax=Topomyia yanbarensis TaxID=2498891 RepID=UPI00273A7E42|nr:uncharacterized protein LOC131679320 [Topomyia yanbarensis]